MAKYKGAMPLLYARVGKDGKAEGDCCPRPLSRKKLKALLSQRPGETTASELAQRFGRTPGEGKFRGGARRRLEDLQSAPPESLSRGDGALLGLLAALFSSRARARSAGR